MPDFPGTERNVNAMLLVPCLLPFLFQTGTTAPRLQMDDPHSVGMIPVFRMEHNGMLNRRRPGAPSALNISAETPHPLVAVSCLVV